MQTTPAGAIHEDPIKLEILRSRLMAITAEAESALLKASFSTIISLAQDFTVEAHDSRGVGLAHSRRSVSEFSAILPITMRHFLTRYPIETLEPGDVLLTNDPWQCAGHLGDFTIAYPVFRANQVVAFMTSMAHHSDVGGTLDDTGARDVFEEGIWIPITKLYRHGQINQDVMDIIRANVRTPDMVVGDLNAQISACEVGARELLRLMEEFRLPDLDKLAQSLYDRAQSAMEDAIASVPDGRYPFILELDGVDDEPLRIQVVVKVSGKTVRVDYSGTSPQTQSGINSTWNFTFAESVNALKSVLIPEVPSTEGCFSPITVTAPDGCILNARRPAPVKGRTRTGFHIHGALFGALAQVVPEKVQAHSGLGGRIAVNGEYPDGARFNSHLLFSGGLGARARLDGINTLRFPTSSANVPVEAFESQAPLVVERKELVPDSGGRGQFRGGLSQRISVHLPRDFSSSVTLSIRPQMMVIPAIGLNGGQPGSRTRVFLNDEELPSSSEIVRRGSVRLLPGESLTIVEAGGGGFGLPEIRDRTHIQTDLEAGYISEEHAKTYSKRSCASDSHKLAACARLGQ